MRFMDWASQKAPKSKVVVSVIWFNWFTCTVWGLCWYQFYQTSRIYNIVLTPIWHQMDKKNEKWRSVVPTQGLGSKVVQKHCMDKDDSEKKKWKRIDWTRIFYLWPAANRTGLDSTCPQSGCVANWQKRRGLVRSASDLKAVQTCSSSIEFWFVSKRQPVRKPWKNWSCPTEV